MPPPHIHKSIGKKANCRPLAELEKEISSCQVDIECELDVTTRRVKDVVENYIKDVDLIIVGLGGKILAPKGKIVVGATEGTVLLYEMLYYSMSRLPSLARSNVKA